MQRRNTAGFGEAWRPSWPRLLLLLQLLLLPLLLPPHWPNLAWNISKSWLQKVDFLENYAFLAMQSDNVTFYACKIIKVTSGFNLKKTNFFARWRQHPQKSLNIFQIQITPVFRRLHRLQGCLEKRNHPLSLNLVVWCAKIGPKTKKLWKTVKKPSFLTCFFVNSEVFRTFLVFWPNFSAPNHQIQTQWIILLF